MLVSFFSEPARRIFAHDVSNPFCDECARAFGGTPIADVGEL
jgi:hypothetical protein